ncbi:hypothetical protein L596_027261 [Steinernema carpocapsae]|nr:hypothetical protein L596_027261 [Steinernema carpocapsae]
MVPKRKRKSPINFFRVTLQFVLIARGFSCFLAIFLSANPVLTLKFPLQGFEMFKKPFNVRKNTNVRSSDRKKLLARVGEDVAAAIGKTQLAIVAITNFNNVRMNLYVFDRTPLLFEIAGEGTLYPTVYLTWLTSEACPIIYVHERVFEYLENGADLMLPGVLRSGPFQVPPIERDGAVALSMLTEDGKIKGPVAVGRALMSSNDMIANKMQGRGVQILHIFRDALW